MQVQIKGTLADDAQHLDPAPFRRILLPATRCYCDLSGSFSDDVGKSHKSPVQ